MFFVNGNNFVYRGKSEKKYGTEIFVKCVAKIRGWKMTAADVANHIVLLRYNYASYWVDPHENILAPVHSLKEYRRVKILLFPEQFQLFYF